MELERLGGLSAILDNLAFSIWPKVILLTEEDFKNEKDLKNQDNLKSEDDKKYEDDHRNEDALKMKMTSKGRPYYFFVCTQLA